ncbi:MAG TPA: V-type ATP synthase subunit D [Micromonosporaceae bacterium]|nr:V-type ATP synthase subunit D [Micromonosporaceae bacterium]
MPDLRQLPAGRAGRLWLRRRLAVARRGVDLLDHQLRILRVEHERLRLLVAQTGPVWRDRCQEAERWLLRGAIVGGQREIRLTTATAPAEVAVTVAEVMGVRYPDRVTVTLPRPPPSVRPAASAGLVLAVDAYGAALQAAVRHAAAEAALSIVEAQVAEVSRRKRAISQRWVPRLESALHDLSQRLEDQERDEMVRRHWVAELQDGAVR